MAGRRPGCPPWLDHQGTAPDEAAARLASRAAQLAAEPGPFLRRVRAAGGYLSPGQKASVRAVSAARSGDSVICVLPTGSGKTDIVLTRAICHRPRQACLIVPTVALALDLERRVQELTGQHDTTFAYHGGLADAEENRAGRAVPRAAAQWLIITSPEAACTALARPLEAAAAEGRLDLLAIDEAHIVAEWGDAFRPAFQTLAGLRRRLLRPRARRPAPGHRDAHRDPGRLRAPDAAAALSRRSRTAGLGPGHPAGAGLVDEPLRDRGRQARALPRSVPAPAPAAHRLHHPAFLRAVHQRADGPVLAGRGRADQAVASVAGSVSSAKRQQARPGPAPGRRRRPTTSTSSWPRRRSGWASTSRMSGP